MKKLHILGVAISAVLCVPMVAQASDGTIGFDGALTDSTCSVTTGNPAGSFAVTLPTLSASLLASSGKTAGTTAFKIIVANCGSTSTVTKFRPFFETGPTIDFATGFLKNTTGGATFVELELVNTDGSLIDPRLSVDTTGAGQGVQNTTFTLGAGGGVGYYAVRYHATGTATPGTVISTVMYSMIYN